MTRQEAIDVLKADYPDAWYEEDLREAVDMAIASLRGDVPDTNDGDTISRKAAIDYFVTNVGFHDEDGYPIDDSDELRKIWAEYFNGIPPAQPEPQWIPCSEGMPKKTGYYICTCHDGIRYRTSALKWSTGWVLTGARSYWKVIAWMPLPEPWKGGTRE